MTNELLRENIKNIEETIDYSFDNWHLLQQAFIRRSFSKENGGENNEVLEFIGDKVLDLIVVQVLDNEYGSITDGEWEEYHSEKSEGKLTEIKKNLVDKTMLAHRIDLLDLGKYLLMGKGDIKNNIQDEPSVKEDLFEAIIGAVAIDSGYNMDKLYEVVLTMLDPIQYIRNGFDMDVTNYIQEVQEWNQSYNGTLPIYSYDMDYSGILHCRISITDPEGRCLVKNFESIGINKPEARKNAAKEAYDYLYENDYLYDEDDFTEIVGDPDEDNAVAQLNILSTKGYFSTPNYEFEETYDEDGNPEWKCILTIDEYDYEIHNTASTKKEAKRLCAYEMYEAILNED